MQKKLLSIIEQGGYPDFKSLYQEQGYEVTVLHSMRKAMSFIKKNHPDIIVAEFNVQTDFRDRTSNLESLLATVEHSTGKTGNFSAAVIVFYEKDNQMQLDKLKVAFSNFHPLPFPIDTGELKNSLVLGTP